LGAVDGHSIEDGTIGEHELAAGMVVPVGAIVPTAAQQESSCWQFADGERVARDQFPVLVEAIGTTFGDGLDADPDTVSLPDLRGRVAVGADGAAGRLSGSDALGTSGGEEKHKLTEAEMPRHSHWTSLNIVGIPTAGATANAFWPGGGGSVGRSSDAVGGDQPHNVMQPYQVVNHLIRTC
jgi:microcystin-dependent protein